MNLDTPSSKKKEVLRWTLFALLGLFLGFLLTHTSANLGAGSDIPLWLTFPFIILLLSIAVVPIAWPHWWHKNYPNVALFLGGIVTAVYQFGVQGGNHKLLQTAHEYTSFLALVGGLFFVASCIKLDFRGRGTAYSNTLLLGFGAIIANILGTTGASLLLIRPFIKLNSDRIQPLHIVFFIIIVSNCGGVLTPVGDPPLYLGYLKGVPFTWTFENLWSSWLLVVGTSLIGFFIFDKYFAHTTAVLTGENKIQYRINGKIGLISLVLMTAAVFIDPILWSLFSFDHFPMTALAQVAIAWVCFTLTKTEIKIFNHFSFEPFKEVAIIFIGIFATMIPALDYLSANASNLALNSAEAFYYGTGLLSALLDNAPTYLNFLQLAVGPNQINQNTITALLSSSSGVNILKAISSGAVFFGALTYIGNGPNFMVRSLSESIGVRTPTFFGYLLRAVLILGPILLLHSLLMF